MAHHLYPPVQWSEDELARVVTPSPEDTLVMVIITFYYFVYCTLYLILCQCPFKFILSNHFIIVQLGEAVSQLPVWAVVLLVAALAVITIIAGAVAFVHRERITDLTDRLRLNWLVFVCFFLYVGKQFFKF
jgi:hypothetical protein